MKIGLVGYGKMGKAIEAIAIERGHQIAFTVNSTCPIAEVDISAADVVIEFTRPELALEHIHAVVDNHVPIVVGTTGWNQKEQDVFRHVEQTNGSLLYASNFSIGVNIFFALNRKLARLMSDFSDYEASIEEIHHLQKLDAPSGTAISLANGILDEHDNYLSWVCGENNPPSVRPQQLPVTAYREPDVPGTHIVTYRSEIDTIQLTHEAHSRKGFALGAVIAAEWISDKKGVFTMNDVLNISME